MKTVNRFWVFAIVFSLLTTFFIGIDASGKDVLNGVTGDCLWEYNAVSKTLTLSAKSGGNGKTASFSDYSKNESFPDIAGEVVSVVIEEGVTELGNHLFLNFSSLTSVDFPEKSLVSVGEGVFRNCDKLRTIELPASLSSISRALFWDCLSLENVTLRGSYKTLPEIIFGQCPRLNSVTIPAGVSSVELSVSQSGIPRGVFYKDNNIKTINYGGTKEEWKKLLEGIIPTSSDETTLNDKNVSVMCSDGMYAYKNTEAVSEKESEPFYNKAYIKAKREQNLTERIKQALGLSDEKWKFETLMDMLSNGGYLRQENDKQEETDKFNIPVDYITARKLFDVPWRAQSEGSTNSNTFQGFAVYNGYAFAVYDGGYCRVYNFDTGAFLQEFRLKCALESAHSSGVYFGKYKYSESDPFPLMYISCDLSTLSCYVERLLVDSDGKFSSEMVQLIDFSKLKGWNGIPTTKGVTTHSGSFALLEKDTNTIIYLGRQKKAIGEANNRFVLAGFKLPLCRQGSVEGTVYPGGYKLTGESAEDTITVNCPVVHLKNEDIIKTENATQDEDGYYYWDYYGRYIQGAYIYRGRLLAAHGINENHPNNWKDKTFYTGIMNYKYDSDKMLRFIDVSSSINWYGEPQALTIYNDRMIHYIKGAIYEINIAPKGLKASYDILSTPDAASVTKAIAAAVEADIDPAYKVERVDLPENFNPAKTQKFTATVSIYTTWNVESRKIDVSLTIK